MTLKECYEQGYKISHAAECTGYKYQYVKKMYDLYKLNNRQMKGTTSEKIVQVNKLEQELFTLIDAVKHQPSEKLKFRLEFLTAEYINFDALN